MILPARNARGLRRMARNAVINIFHCDGVGTWSLIHAISSDVPVKLTWAMRADLGTGLAHTVAVAEDAPAVSDPDETLPSVKAE